MISFSCRACEQPLLLAQVGSWLLGEPFCGPQCVERIDQEVLRSKTPTIDEHLSAMLPLLIQMDTFLERVVQAADRAHQAEQRSNSANGTAGVVGGMLFGSILTSVVQGVVESTAGHEQDAVLEQINTLDVMARDLVRRTMAMHGTHYPAPPAVLRAVQLSEGLDAGQPYAVSFQAKQIQSELQTAQEEIRAWDRSPYR